MRHPNIHFFAVKPQVFGKVLPDVGAVDISINAFQRFKGGQLFGYLHAAKITGMPNLVAVFKMFKHGVVNVAVGIRNEAYFNQLNRNMLVK